jgi:hypothetical protein
MKPNTLKIIHSILGSGISNGVHRAYKHNETPSTPFITTCIEDAVDLRMSEVFSFEEAYETEIDLKRVREIAAIFRSDGCPVIQPDELKSAFLLLDALLDFATGESV